MGVKEWADAARRSKEYQTPRAQHIIEILQTLLDGKSTPQDAAQKIASIHEPLIREDPTNVDNGNLWGIFCNAVRALGYNEEINVRLVDFLRSLKNISVITDDGEIAVQHEEGGAYWSDLPDLPWMFREYGIYFNEEDDMSDEEWRAQQMPFLNATTFAATCMSQKPPVLNMSLHVEICFGAALEIRLDTEEPGKDPPMFVPPAATWIFLAGKQIHQLCIENYKRIDATPREGTGLWAGNGFSLERWSFWKKRFSETQAMLNLDPPIREYAGKALAKMKEIEGISSTN